MITETQLCRPFFFFLLILFCRVVKLERVKNQRTTSTTATELYLMNKNPGSPTHYSSRSCWAVETHPMKLSIDSFCADVNTKEGLKLQLLRTLVTLTHDVSQRSVTQLCNLMWSAMGELLQLLCYLIALTPIKADNRIPNSKEIPENDLLQW